MKISLISTVRNEEKNIARFIDSILNQTIKPNELIIVDGGSKDKTYDILKKYAKKYRIIRAYQIKKANISKGRNFAIKHSHGQIIFTSDCSTIFEKDWIKKISSGFDKKTDLVFGKYFVKPRNAIERYLISRLPNWDKINPETFIPSNRHVAFKRTVWEKVGGYPEHLTRADDNWFHEKAHSLGLKYKFLPNAKVEWILSRNLRNTLRLAFLDSKTEGFSGIFIKRKIYFAELLLLGVIIALILLGIFVNIKILIYSIILGAILWIAFAGIRTYFKTKDFIAGLVGLGVMPLLYMAHVSGLIWGIIQRIFTKNEK
jgi:glycosyltransferase involved in cell wall biosynthesis